jgi:hypothetical protein
VIYEQIDSYLAVRPSEPKALLRGLAKYVTGHTAHLRLNYWKAIADMCARADAVVCTTEEQRADILRFCDNVHVVLDIHDDVIKTCKTTYATGPIFNLVWEGLPENVSTFREIKPVLQDLKRRHRLALHLVTDADWKPHLKKYGHRHTIDVARKIFDPVFVYSWNEYLSATIISSCDLAVIPIPLDVPLAAGKPENKLILLWRLGMPTLVSATPAYSRAMERAGLTMACSDNDQWMAALERFIGDESARGDAARTGQRTANGNFYGTAATLDKWDAVFSSVL